MSDPSSPPSPSDPAPPRRKVVTRRALLDNWWVLPVGATAGAFGYMGWYGSRVLLGKQQAGVPRFEDAPPKRIAALDELTEDWADLNFIYDRRPCTVLRVPRPVDGGLSVNDVHYAAYSRVCTHLGCSVNLVRDIEVLAFAFNYRPPLPDRHPQLGCRCHFSVFDPLKAGEAVFGKANGPLPRVRLEVRGGDLYATGIEPAPKLGG